MAEEIMEQVGLDQVVELGAVRIHTVTGKRRCARWS